MRDSNDSKIKLIDLFSGAGGLSNGFEQTGRFEVVGAVEINKDAADTYISNHGNNEDIIIKPENSDISDITKIDFKKILEKEKIDGSECVVIGGPPCQGFSNANRQKNYLISGNNQLVKEFVRAIDEIRPMALLMENVKTIDSEKHKFFVTKDVKGTKSYSSLTHLNQIKNRERFWKEDNLTLIETDNVELESLINNLITKTLVEPLINNEIHLSRIRSITRKLKREEMFEVNKSKEKLEIRSIIDELRNYNAETLDLNDLINEVCTVLELIVENKNEDIKKYLEVLLRFEDINQLLRYINEIDDENIYCLSDPKVYCDENKLSVKVPVLSYSVVNYLKLYFEFLGYKIDPKVMLASDYYVPQNRERFMILGVHETKNKLPVKMPFKISTQKSRFTVEDAIGDLEKIDPITQLSDKPLNYVPSRKTKMYEYFRNGMKKEEKNMIYNHINTASRPLSKERFNELQATGGKNFHSLSLDLKEISYTDISRTQNTIYLRLNYDEPSPTVVNVRKSMWQHPNKPQALSIREAARLQSFKDNFIFKGTKDKQYQQIGNAVPPLLARAVAEQLLLILGDEPIKKIECEFKSQSESIGNAMYSIIS